MTWLISLLAGRLKVPTWAVEVLLGFAAGLGIFLCILYYGARQRERGAAEAKPGIIRQFEDQQKDAWAKEEAKDKQDAEEIAAAAKLLSSERTELEQDKAIVVKFRAAADATLDAARTAAQSGKEAGYAQALTLHDAELLAAIRAESATLAAASK